MATEVSLSSGETFYVDAGLEDVARKLNSSGYLARLGGRYVNGGQVAQLTPVREVPSIHTPERLQLEEG